MGWRTDTTAASTTNKNLTQSISANTNFYAVYSGTLTLSYDANGGTGAPAAQTGTQYLNATATTGTANAFAKSNVTFTISSTKPTKNGWTFVSWNTKQDGSGTDYNAGASYTTNVTATVYAKWNKTVNVYFYSGVNKASVNTFPLTFTNNETTKQVTAPTKGVDINTWTQLGWTTSKDANATVAGARIAGDTVLNVNVNNGPFEYFAIYSQRQTLTYNSNATGDTTVKNIPGSTNGTAYYNSSDSKTNVTHNIPATKPTRAGYTFSSWNKLANGSGKSYAAGGTFTNEIQNETLYAQWNENSYTITYVNGNDSKDTTVNYTITTSIVLIAAPTRDGYVFVGWKVTEVDTETNWTSGDLYGAGAKIGTGKYGNVKLVAQWVYVKDAEDKSGEYNQDNTIKIVTGVDAKGNERSVTTTKYDDASFKEYTDAINAYKTAKNSLPTDVNASDYGTRLAAATDKLQEAIDALMKIVLTPRNLEAQYLNSFFIDATTTRHNLSEINLNHYAVSVLDTAKSALTNGTTIKNGNHKITDTDTDGKTFQEKLNAYVLAMAQAYKNTTNVKSTGPAFKVYETVSAAQNVKDASNKTLAGATAVNYVYAGKGNYTYYCYTNSTNPTVLITVDDIAVNSRVCYPTSASAANAPIFDGSAKKDAASSYSTLTIPADKKGTVDYSAYTNSQIGTKYNYTQKQVIKLTPEFTSGTNGKVTYEFTAHDDARDKNVATMSALSSGIGNANSFSENLTAKKTITIVIDYHSGDLFDVTGDQVQNDKYLNQYHLFRHSGGASNWELPKTGDSVYKVVDNTYGQTDRGSFTFTYELGATDIANGKINTTKASEIAELFNTAANYNAAKGLTFVGTNKSSAKTAGLGYQVWGNNWSFNYYPKTQSYTYVHLVDRWGNAVDKVFYVGNQDGKSIVAVSSADGGYTILEDGGSGIDTLSLNASSMEILTDENSSFENNVYKTTGNTIRIKTGETNKSYTLSMKDKATNASSAAVTSDENGIITFNVEDTAYRNGVYTFTMNGIEINLYSDKYILEIYDGTAEEGESAEITVVTTAEVGKTQFKDADGNTITLSACEMNEDGTKSWTISKSKPAGEYEYTISVKVGYTWYSENSVGKMTFTERILDSGLIRSAEYDAESGLYKITIEGRATKIQFITEDGMTRTYTRYSEAVKSRKSYDAEGNEVPDTGRLLDHEVWLVNARLYSGQNYTVAGKFEAGWNREGTATLTVH